MDELDKIRKCFCDFIEGSLITHDINAVFDLFTEDIMGIGMGAQGIVRCKEDMRPILTNTRNDIDDTQTMVQYSNMQIRYYGGDYANICAAITIHTKTKEKQQQSHIGQCASLRRINGVWKLNMVQATPLSVDIQEIDAYPLCFAEDEIVKYRKQEQQAELDLMTGVYNKETARSKIERAMQLYSLPETCAFFMLDLDCFKRINDTYGHAEGDRVILQASNILKRIFRGSDIIGRIGGDEFCVFYTGKNQDEVLAQKAEKICEAVRQIHPVGSGRSGTTVSIGIVKRTGQESYDELYQRADKALYVRKAQQGRDGYTFYK